MPEFIATADGSLTLLDTRTGEHYHNMAGAWAEAWHHYAVPAEFARLLQPGATVCWLDACFGLGYNTWASLAWVAQYLETQPERKPITIQVLGIDNDPDIFKMAFEILQVLDLSPLPEIRKGLEHNAYYQTFITAAQTSQKSLSTRDAPAFLVSPRLIYEGLFAEGQLRFQLWAWCANLVDALRSLVAENCALLTRLNLQPPDVVFHDAFSPRQEPALWHPALFAAYRQLLAPKQGRLLTYSRARTVKDAMQAAGFTWQGVNAPLGAKRGASMGCLA